MHYTRILYFLWWISYFWYGVETLDVLPRSKAYAMPKAISGELCTPCR